MNDYLINLKSAIIKLKKDQRIAGNQLVFKEKEALILTITFGILPILVLVIAIIGTRI